MRCASSSLFFDARTLCQQLNNGFVLNAGQRRKANISFFIVFVKIFSADTFSKTVCSIYSFINSLDVLLLGVVKLASRKNWKDYGVLRTCIRELKVKR